MFRTILPFSFDCCIVYKKAVLCGVINCVDVSVFLVFPALFCHHRPLLQPDYMYCWAHSEPILQQLDILPGKLQLESWPPLVALLEAQADKKQGVCHVSSELTCPMVSRLYTN